MVDIPLDQLTNRQIHLHLISLYESQHETLTRIENFMADLSTSVSELQAAVDGVAVRVEAQRVPLVEALAAAQAALEAAQIDDAAQAQAVADALANAQTAADAIGEQVTELNAIGAEPEVPVESPAPSEEAPAE